MLSGFDNRERRMNVGKTLFAQVMEFVPWKTFEHIVERHKGDAECALLVARICFASWLSRSSPGVRACAILRFVLKPAASRNHCC